MLRREYRKNTQFNKLPIGTEFMRGGTLFIKQSSRTAKLKENNRWFYFGQKDIVFLK